MDTRWRKDLAVALSYDKREMKGPKILARGERKMASQMARNARRYGIPVHRDAELVDALSEVDSDGYVPDELYSQLAEHWLRK